MFRHFCKSKIHRATVTEANLDYVGSITVSTDLMEAANLMPYEKVQVVDIDNGARLETYVIPAKGPTGEICPNGAAARLIHKGDTIIIISYCMLDEKEMAGFKPKVVFVDESNIIQSVKENEIAGMTHLQLLTDAG
jgi:aspartate 1-decarboxylase